MNREQIEQAAVSGPHAFLYRDALQNNWIDFSFGRMVQSGSWYVPMVLGANGSGCDMDRQLRANLCEALVSALTHSNKKIAFRAFKQAVHYVARLEGLGTTAGVAYYDALSSAQQRIETFLV